MSALTLNVALFSFYLIFFGFTAVMLNLMWKIGPSPKMYVLCVLCAILPDCGRRVMFFERKMYIYWHVLYSTVKRAIWDGIRLAIILRKLYFLLLWLLNSQFQTAMIHWKELRECRVTFEVRTEFFLSSIRVLDADCFPVSCVRVVKNFLENCGMSSIENRSQKVSRIRYFGKLKSLRQNSEGSCERTVQLPIPSPGPF